MPVHHVSYDLNRPGQDYQDLIKELKKTDHRHILDSSWLISTSESPHELFTRLKKYIDGNDRLLITRVTSEKSGWLLPDDWKWLNARL